MLGVVASCAAPSYQIAQKNNGAQAQPVASQDGSRARVGTAEMKQRIIEAMSRVYAEEFTLSELRQIVAFHESPTGRKLRSRNTALKDEVKQAAQEEGRKAAIELLTPLLIQWALEAKGQVS